MTLKSIYPDICTSHLAASRDFYTELLGLEVVWESDWYATLSPPGLPDMQIALVAADHDSVPAGFATSPAGVLISIEVDEVAPYWERARASDVPIAQELRDEEFGQRHFMAIDPDGLLVDVLETRFIPTA